MNVTKIDFLGLIVEVPEPQTFVGRENATAHMLHEIKHCKDAIREHPTLGDMYNERIGGLRAALITMGYSVGQIDRMMEAL